MKEKLKNFFLTKGRRILMSLFGVVICAISVGFFKHAALGVDPFQSLMAGLDAMIPIDFGTLYMIVNAILLVFSLVFDRKNIGIATFINLFLLGYITDGTMALLAIILPNPDLWVRICCLAGAIIVICFGSAFYMTADMGVSTYDAVAIVISRKWKWGKFQYCRIGADLVCVIAGCAIFLLAGGTWKEIPTIAGVGTIITAFFMGPLIELFNKKIARPFLAKGKHAK